MRIAVGMSGGVDSSVTAALLNQEGHEVIGLFMRLGVGSGDGAERRCCSLEDGRDARRVADALGIRFYDLDYRQTFRKVIDYFIDSYEQGETPNPCVMCNRDVKFDALWKQAQQLGCEAIATGHYAQIIETPTGKALGRGLDLHKDQSYFLFPIEKNVLNHILFPLGQLNKKEVRNLAEEFNLPTKKKSESQDICFVGQASYTDVLKREKPDSFKSGSIVNPQGETLGSHEGHQHFTIGQRRGLGIAAKEPLYVTNKNVASNTVTIGPRQELLTRELFVNIFQWHYSPQVSEIVDIMIRYNSEPLKARVLDLGNEKSPAQFEFLSDEERTSPGQAAVIYRENIVLGGGWILKNLNE